MFDELQIILKSSNMLKIYLVVKTHGVYPIVYAYLGLAFLHEACAFCSKTEFNERLKLFTSNLSFLHGLSFEHLSLFCMDLRLEVTRGQLIELKIFTSNLSFLHGLSFEHLSLFSMDLALEIPHGQLIELKM